MNELWEFLISDAIINAFYKLISLTYERVIIH